MQTESKAKPMAAMHNIAIATQWTSTGMPMHHSGAWAYPQEDCPGLMDRGHEPKVPQQPLSKIKTVYAFAPPVYTIYVTAGWAASSVVTRSPLDKHTYVHMHTQTHTHIKKAALQSTS